MDIAIYQSFNRSLYRIVIFISIQMLSLQKRITEHLCGTLIQKLRIQQNTHTAVSQKRDQQFDDWLSQFMGVPPNPSACRRWTCSMQRRQICCNSMFFQYVLTPGERMLQPCQHNSIVRTYHIMYVQICIPHITQLYYLKSYLGERNTLKTYYAC